MFDVSKYALASSERLLNMFHEGFNVVSAPGMRRLVEHVKGETINAE